MPERDLIRPIDPRPVQKCPCGDDCAWCIGANEARAKFPRATVAPAHDSAKQNEHQCIPCFEALAEAALAAGDPSVTVFECNPEDIGGSESRRRVRE